MSNQNNPVTAPTAASKTLSKAEFKPLPTELPVLDIYSPDLDQQLEQWMQALSAQSTEDSSSPMPQPPSLAVVDTSSTALPSPQSSVSSRRRRTAQQSENADASPRKRCPPGRIDPPRESGTGRFLKCSMPQTPAPQNLQSNPTVTSDKKQETTTTTPDYPMPSAEELASIICATIMSNSLTPTRNPLVKLTLDNLLVKKFKPRFVEYIQTLLSPNDSLSYITLDLIITSTLMHFNFI